MDCNQKVTEFISDETGLCEEDIYAYITAALDDIYFNDCRLGKIVKECIDIQPTNPNIQHNPELAQTQKCDRSQCILDKIVKDESTQCQGGNPTFTAVAAFLAEKYCG